MATLRRIPPIALALAAALGASCLSLLPTSTPPFEAFTGPPGAEGAPALFSYKGTGAYGLLLYAVDGEPRRRHGDNRLLEGSYSNTLMCGFDVLVRPGRHAFEFYTVDTNPPRTFRLEFDLAPGRTYLLEGRSAAFAVSADGAPVETLRAEVPVLDEPSEGEPHAVLNFSRPKGAMDANAWILRVDGMVRTPLYKRHPRWVVLNYSGLASGIVNAIGGVGMLIQPNVEAAEGNFGIRLEPGPHRIDYQAEALFAGQRIMGDVVRTVEFTAEAGRSYDIRVVPSGEEIEGIQENGIVIVGR